MDGTYPVDVWMVFHLRLYRLLYLGEFLLCLDEVYLGEEAVAVHDLTGVRAQLVGKLGEDADDFLAFLSLQLTHSVVGLHHLGRFDEDGLSCGTLIVYDTLDFLLQGRDDRDDESAVAQGRGDVFLHHALALC